MVLENTFRPLSRQKLKKNLSAGRPTGLTGFPVCKIELIVVKKVLVLLEKGS